MPNFIRNSKLIVFDMRYIDPKALDAIRGSALFYPGSGDDCLEPFKLFDSALAEYWFVDKSYFVRDSADRAVPQMTLDGWQLKSVTIDGPPQATIEMRTDPETNRDYPFLEPCTRRERYVSSVDGSQTTICRRRGYGQISISMVPDIGVFFHRGDSVGESGSGVWWLSKRRIGLVLDRLRDGGLIVTDGSLSNVKQLSRIKNTQSSSEAAYGEAPSFVKWERLWTCVGWATERHGRPTLIWQLTSL